jgi:hypothetical protein
VSCCQIPPSQLHGQGRSQRVYEIACIPSSMEEDESASMPKSDGVLIPGSEVSISENTHDVFENTGDILLSQLTERSVVPNSRSPNVLSVQVQRIEKECSMLIGRHTLLHERFPSAARLSVLVVSMWTTANRQVGCRLDPDEIVIKQVSAPKGITSALETQLRTIGQKSALPCLFPLDARGERAPDRLYDIWAWNSCEA